MTGTTTQSAGKALGIGAFSLEIIATVAFIVSDISKTEPDFNAESSNKGLTTFYENKRRYRIFEIISQ